MRVTLIADSGATKCEWCLLVDGKKKKSIITDGLSPYFLTADQITALLQKHLLPNIKNFTPKNIFFYGTGLANPANAKVIKSVLKGLFTKAKIEINHDLTAAARALCGKQKGIACILGTGANAGYYNGNKIAKNSPGLGYILGDEGSGAYLGKKVVQYYLYQTFDEELMARFTKRFNTSKDEILKLIYQINQVSHLIVRGYSPNYIIFRYIPRKVVLVAYDDTVYLENLNNLLPSERKKITVLLQLNECRQNISNYIYIKKDSKMIFNDYDNFIGYIKQKI